MKKEYPDILKLEGEKWHNPDPATGKLGTRVPAEWLQTTEDSLKSLTLEMLEVLKAAGINPNELNNTQVRDAIQKMILARVINYNDIQGRPVVKDSLGDDRTNPASQRVVNDVNRDVVTAQKTANNAHALAQSKQDKLEFVGDGKVMREGAYGIGEVQSRVFFGERSSFVGYFPGSPGESEGDINANYSNGVRCAHNDNTWFELLSNHEGANFYIRKRRRDKYYKATLFTDLNTTIDKSGFLRASGSANALTTSDVTQSLGTSTSLVASQALVNSVNSKIKLNTASKNQNGWWKCGDTGLIIQYGKTSANNETYFPIAFNTCLSITASLNARMSNLDVISIHDVTNTKFNSTGLIPGRDAGVKRDHPIYFIAIGY